MDNRSARIVREIVNGRNTIADIQGRSIYDYVDTERTSREGLHKSTTTALDIGNSSNPNELSSFGSETAIPMENVEVKLKPFSPLTIDWPSYELLLSRFFHAKHINDNATKLAVLLNCGGSIISDVVRSSFPSGRFDETSMDDLQEILRQKFSCENDVISNRVRFFRRLQQPHESMANYIDELKQLGQRCQFAESFDEHLRDQLIVGISSEKIRHRLICDQEILTLQRVIAIVLFWEEILEEQSDLLKDFSKFQHQLFNVGQQREQQSSIELNTGVVEVDLSPVHEYEQTPRKRGRPRKTDPIERILIKVSLKDVVATSKVSTDAIESIHSSSENNDEQKRGKCERIGETNERPIEDVRNEVDAPPNEVPPTETTVKIAKAARIPNQSSSKVEKKRGRPLSVPMVPGGKRFKCQYCDYMTNTRRCVKRHEMTHTGEKPHPCRFCELRFRERQHLQNHERLHTGELPYICEHCGRGFAKSSTLTDHIRTHTREAPHLCEFCGRGFIQKSALNTHVRIHTGCRPHVCEFCQKAFTTSHLLKNHKKTHNGMWPSFPEKSAV